MAHWFRQPINTNDNTPAEVLNFCLAFGCDTEVRYGSSAGSAMNGIGCLCYNYPCADYRLLAVGDESRMARVGYASAAAARPIAGVWPSRPFPTPTKSAWAIGAAR